MFSPCNAVDTQCRICGIEMATSETGTWYGQWSGVTMVRDPALTSVLGKVAIGVIGAMTLAAGAAARRRKVDETHTVGLFVIFGRLTHFSNILAALLRSAPLLFMMHLRLHSDVWNPHFPHIFKNSNSATWNLKCPAPEMFKSLKCQTREALK